MKANATTSAIVVVPSTATLILRRIGRLRKVVMFASFYCPYTRTASLKSCESMFSPARAEQSWATRALSSGFI